MILNKTVCVVLPAYNAAKTLAKTVKDIPDIIDRILIIDDHSSDRTVNIAQRLGLEVVIHPENRGYGGNQKTCYDRALQAGEDIIIMLHPDYQYTPKLLTAMAAMLACGEYDVVLGSRILGKGALSGGMPVYKYIANRILTFIENILLGQKLSEYHTGYRGYQRAVLENIDYHKFSNDFIFDNQLLVQSIVKKMRIGELSCPTRYFPEASSINLWRSCRYGFGVLREAVLGFLAIHGIIKR